MTAENNLTEVPPSKAKTWVGLVGAALTLVIPWVIQVQGFLPEPWPGVVGGVIALLTALGIYKAPYVPPGIVLAPASPQVIAAAQYPDSPPNREPGRHEAPWRDQPDWL